ncbi:MAG: LamG-like jellyroll fold domain-containing protein [Candidatus Paceibacterota bacterium]|jgi:prepilin-type N-terminal cleavage/methylation domain-containing protein
MNFKHGKEKAFTLIELLVVIAIVGILSSVIYTNITGLRDRARVTAGIRFDSSTLHSIGDQLVGEWTFDEGSGTALDTSGYGNNGTSANWPTWQATSGYNSKGVYSFDGASNAVSIADNSVFSIGTSDFTVSFWVKSPFGKTPATGHYPIILAKGMTSSATAKTWGFMQRPSGNNTWGWYQALDAGGWNVLGNQGALSDGWHMILVKREGTTETLFLDGRLISTYASAGTSLTNNLPIKIGNGGETNFSGFIDNIRVYNSALSGSEIQRLYAEGLSSHPNLANK